MSYVDLPGVGLLISGVERRPVLYDTFCTDYSDRGSKARAWKEVAAEIYEDWHELSVVDKDVRGELKVETADNKRCTIP